MPDVPNDPTDPATGTDPVHPEVRFERSDADVRGVLLFGAVLIVVAVLAHMVLWGFFRSTQKAERARQPELPAVARDLPRFPQDIRDIPPPRLQVRDIDDMRALRAREKAKLDDPPSWVSAKGGIARVPIEEAMRLLEDPRVAAANGARTRPEKGKQK
jgi:hypothetical protein